MMGEDVLIGGASAVFLLVFFVQTIKESMDLESRFVPLVTLAVGLTMFIVADILPDEKVEYYAKCILVVAAASASVRYVKNGKEHAERNPAGSVQEQRYVGERDRPQAGSETTTARLR